MAHFAAINSTSKKKFIGLDVAAQQQQQQTCLKTRTTITRSVTSTTWRTMTSPHIRTTKQPSRQTRQVRSSSIALIIDVYCCLCPKAIDLVITWVVLLLLLDFSLHIINLPLHPTSSRCRLPTYLCLPTYLHLPISTYLPTYLSPPT